MRYFILILLAVLSLFGCEEGSTPSATDLADNVRGILTQSVEGLIIPGEEGGTLYVCETAEAMVFADPRGLLQKAMGDSLVYGATVTGQLEFAVSRDGESFQVKEVEYISGQWFRSTCLMIQHLQGLGNEPGWELRIDPPHDFILRTNYGAEEVTFPYVLPATTEGNWKYEVAIGEGESADKLQVEVAEQPCQDNMAGSGLSYSITVTHNGEVFSGCGRSLTDAPKIQ